MQNAIHSELNIPKCQTRVHENYDGLIVNDIGFIYIKELPQNILNNPNIGFVNIPDDYELLFNFEELIGTVSGFGRIDNSSKLKKNIFSCLDNFQGVDQKSFFFKFNYFGSIY